MPGVAAADLSAADGRPTQVAVTLSPAADPVVVGAAVQRVLAAHGMGSRLVNGSSPPPDHVAQPVIEEAPESVELAPSATEAIGDLASLTVEESPGEVLVVATATDGRRYSRVTREGGEAMSAAVVAAVGALFLGRAPRLLAVSYQESDGVEVVTVVLQRRDGTRAAGAAVVRSGRPYAVARATWAALRV